MAENTTYPAHFSHFPILAAVVACSTGPVLELGCGHGSTPMLHEICRAMNRSLVTVDGVREWADKFRALETPQHEIRVISNSRWGEQGFPTETSWGVVFVDHGNGEQRHLNVAEFAGVDYAPWVVVHDAHPGGMDLYKLHESFALYQYRYWFRDYWPHTAVLSNARMWGA